MESHILIDPYGRKITSLRVSITSKCNLNCFYCHNEGQSGHEEEMSVELIIRIINKAATLGVTKVKFSGGEPLVRKDFEEMLARLPKLRNVSATTNGVLLSKRAKGLKASGLDRVNISLDTLDPDSYAGICQCNRNVHQQVLDGVHAAVEAGLTPIKLNMVMMEGINSGELNDMISFVKKFDGNVILQIIEPMDFSNDGLLMEMDIITKELESRATSVIERKMHRRKKYMVDGAEIELVKPIDNSVFCANCNRLRVTSDGKLKPCLLRNDNLVDVSHASDSELETLFYKAMKYREPFYKGQPQEVSI